MSKKSDDEELGAARRVKRAPMSKGPDEELANLPPQPQPEPQGGGISSAASQTSEESEQSRRVSEVDQRTTTLTNDDDAPYDEASLTRRTRGASSDNRLELPENRMRAGWDYEYKTTKVMGAEVDSSEVAVYYEQGWRPVPAKEMPELCPPGYQGKYIERMGQLLYMRPMRLSVEARQESYELAEQQKFDKLMAASAVPTTRPGLINPFKTEMNIEGVVGSHKASAKSA